MSDMWTAIYLNKSVSQRYKEEIEDYTEHLSHIRAAMEVLEMIFDLKLKIVNMDKKLTVSKGTDAITITYVGTFLEIIQAESIPPK